MGGRDVDDAAFAATATHGKPCGALFLVARHAQPRRAMSRPVSENCVDEGAAFAEIAAFDAARSQALPWYGSRPLAGVLTKPGRFSGPLLSRGIGRLVLFQDVRTDALRDPGGRRLDRVTGKVGVAGRAADLPVAEQLSDHREVLSEGDGPRGEAVSEVVDGCGSRGHSVVPAPFPADMDFPQAGIFFPESRMVAESVGNTCRSIGSATGNRFGGAECRKTFRRIGR